MDRAVQLASRFGQFKADNAGIGYAAEAQYSHSTFGTFRSEPNGFMTQVMLDPHIHGDEMMLPFKESALNWLALN